MSWSLIYPLMLVSGIALLSACSSPEQQVTVKLKNGSEVAGKLVRQDDKGVTVVTPGGAARTLLAREIVKVEKVQPSAAVPSPAPGGPAPGGNAAADKAAAASQIPAARAAIVETGTPFVVPASGRMTLRAGTTFYFRARELMEGDTATFKAMYTAELLDDTPVDGGMIPARTNFTMEVVSPVESKGQTMVCSLVGIYAGGTEFQPAGGSSAHRPVLGILTSPPARNLPAAQRDLAYRIPQGTMFSFKLGQAITLQAVK